MVSRGRKRRSRPVSELLEDRAVPATFGVPWADPSRLTLSFAPDGTSVAGQPNALFKTLDAQQPTAVRQQDPRFGDIRVGAQAMAPGSLSISVPNDPMRASTWGGDVLINSNDTFGS